MLRRFIRGVPSAVPRMAVPRSALLTSAAASASDDYDVSRWYSPPNTHSSLSGRRYPSSSLSTPLPFPQQHYRYQKRHCCDTSSSPQAGGKYDGRLSLEKLAAIEARLEALPTAAFSAPSSSPLVDALFDSFALEELAGFLRFYGLEAGGEQQLSKGEVVPLLKSFLVQYRAALEKNPKERKEKEMGGALGQAGESHSVAIVSGPLPVVLLEVVDGTNVRLYCPVASGCAEVPVKDVISTDATKPAEGINFDTLNRLASLCGMSACALVYQKKDEKLAQTVASQMAASGFQVNASGCFEELAGCFLSRTKEYKELVKEHQRKCHAHAKAAMAKDTVGSEDTSILVEEKDEEEAPSLFESSELGFEALRQRYQIVDSSPSPSPSNTVKPAAPEVPAELPKKEGEDEKEQLVGSTPATATTGTGTGTLTTEQQPPTTDSATDSPSLSSSLPFASRFGWELLSKLLMVANQTKVLDIGGKGFSVTDAINQLVHPVGDVIVLSVMTVGMLQTFTSVNLRTGERVIAHGSTEDILDGFLSITRDKNAVVVPNSSADEYLIRNCRVQLMKMKRTVHLVWPSSFAERLSAGARGGDPRRLCNAICGAMKWHVADFVLNSKRIAGQHMRKRILGHDADYLEMAAMSAQEINVPSSTEAEEEKTAAEGSSANKLKATGMDDAEVSEITTPTAVRKYLESLYCDERRMAERAAMTGLDKFLLLATMRTTKSHLFREGNPHGGKNYIYAVGFVDYKGNKLFPQQLFSNPHHQHEGGANQVIGKLQLPDLSDYQVLVLHDAKDALIMLWDDPQLQAFIKKGGRVWDTLLGEYLLTAQKATAQNAAILSKLANNYGVTLQGEDLPMDEDTEQSLVLSQARMQVTRDLICLGGIYNAQLKRSVEQAQLLSLKHRMDALLGFVEIERNGLYVDEPTAVQLAVDRHNTQIQAEQLLRFYVPSQLPIDLIDEFNWDMTANLNAYFYGGSIRFGRSTFVHKPNLHKALVELSYIAHSFHALTNDDDVLISRPLLGSNYRIVFFDIESTGLDAVNDRIVEVSFYDLESGKWFNSLVNPQCPIPQEVVEIHGINDDEVSSAPTFADLCEPLLHFLEPERFKNEGDPGGDRTVPPKPDERITILISHNTWSLDEPLLRQEFLRSRGVSLHCLFADSLPIFRAAQPPPKSLRLQEIKTFYHIEEKEAHRASADVSVLHKALLRAVKVTKGMSQLRADAELPPVQNQASALLKAIGASPRDGILLANAKSFSSNSQYVGNTELEVNLPGVVREFFPRNHEEITERLKPRGFDELALQAFNHRGCEVAHLLMSKRRANEAAAKLLTLDPHKNNRLLLRYGDGCIHQDVGLTSTATTRNTSSNPSCQNIPKSDKSDIRRIFTSRFGTDGFCVEIDYSALEIAVQAVLCQDENMLRELNSGIDFHLRRASWLDPAKRSYEELLALKKAGDRDVVALRQKAKIISFQRLYGAGVHLIARSANVPVEEVNIMIDSEKRDYPGIAQFQRLVRMTALRTGNPGLPTHYIFELPTGCRMAFDGRTAHHDLPAMKNYPIQGYAAELVQTMLGRLLRHWADKDFYGRKVHLTNFVHDSVWFDCHHSVLEEVVREGEAILGDVKRHFTQVYPNVAIPLEFGVHTEFGLNMYEMVDFKPENIPILRAKAAEQQQQQVDQQDVAGVDASSSATQVREAAQEEKKEVDEEGDHTAVAEGEEEEAVLEPTPSSIEATTPETSQQQQEEQEESPGSVDWEDADEVDWKQGAPPDTPLHDAAGTPTSATTTGTTRAVSKPKATHKKSVIVPKKGTMASQPKKTKVVLKKKKVPAAKASPKPLSAGKKKPAGPTTKKKSTASSSKKNNKKVTPAGIKKKILELKAKTKGKKKTTLGAKANKKR